MRKFSRRPTRASELPALKAKAEAGDAEAQYELGKIFELGEIVPPDAVESMKWYHRAADLGNAAAQVEVGEMYFDGKVVKQDSAEGLKWLLKAAEQGNGIAHMKLYGRYECGWGVKKDYAEACFWSMISPMGMYPGHIAELTAEQYAAVEKRVKEWQKMHDAPTTKK